MKYSRFGREEVEMKVQVLKTAGVSVTQTRMQYDRKQKKSVEKLVGKTVYLTPGIHEVTEEQLKGLLEMGLCVRVDDEPVAEEPKAEEPKAEEPVAEEAPKKKGKGKKPEAIDLGLD